MPTRNSTSSSLSAPTTGTGSVQRIPHGLGAVPGMVLIALVGGPAGYSQPTIVEGVHDSFDCVVTCTTGWVYRVIAMS